MSTQSSAAETEHSRAVRDMFSGIAGRYDMLNHFLSANIDKRWRRAVVKMLSDVISRPDALVLDVACGTADLSIELRKNGKAGVLGTDFCHPMLELAREKIAETADSLPLIESDALNLSFRDDAFDAVTIAFGLRNVANVSKGLEELRRVLKPGGRLAILEFSSPVVPGFRQLFNFYFAHVLPRIGGLVSGRRSAYEYLPRSVSKFPDQKRLASLLTENGFSSVNFKNLSGGIAAIHTGVKN